MKERREVKNKREEGGREPGRKERKLKMRKRKNRNTLKERRETWEGSKERW